MRIFLAPVNSPNITSQLLDGGFALFRFWRREKTRALEKRYAREGTYLQRPLGEIRERRGISPCIHGEIDVRPSDRRILIYAERGVIPFRPIPISLI